MVEVPPALVSLTVAASVAVAAAFVLRERREDRRWVLAFVFGLAHGFGLAAVLRASGPPPGGVALPLLAFNAGVETAQIVAVVIVVALLRMLGAGDGSPRIRRAFAWATLAIGVFWTAARAADLLRL